MTDLATASYRVAPRTGRTVVATSLGQPKWLPPLVQLDPAKPWGLLDVEDRDEFAERYVAGLAKRWNRLERDLRGLVDEHGALVLCCFEANPADCHRSLLAAFFADRLGIEVPELA